MILECEWGRREVVIRDEVKKVVRDQIIQNLLLQTYSIFAYIHRYVLREKFQKHLEQQQLWEENIQWQGDWEADMFFWMKISVLKKIQVLLEEHGPGTAPCSVPSKSFTGDFKLPENRVFF